MEELGLPAPVSRLFYRIVTAFSGLILTVALIGIWHFFNLSNSFIEPSALPGVLLFLGWYISLILPVFFPESAATLRKINYALPWLFALSWIEELFYFATSLFSLNSLMHPFLTLYEIFGVLIVFGSAPIVHNFCCYFLYKCSKQGNRVLPMIGAVMLCAAIVILQVSNAWHTATDKFEVGIYNEAFYQEQNTINSFEVSRIIIADDCNKLHLFHGQFSDIYERCTKAVSIHQSNVAKQQILQAFTPSKEALRYFTEVGFSPKNRAITKWDINQFDLPIIMDGIPTSEDTRCVTQAFATLQSLVQHLQFIDESHTSFSRQGWGSSNQITIAFSPTQKAEEAAQQNFNTRFDTHHASGNGYIAIDGHLSPATRCAAVYRNLAINLGLHPTGHSHPESVLFASGSIANSFSPIDKEVIQILYMPTVQEGIMADTLSLLDSIKPAPIPENIRDIDQLAQALADYEVKHGSGALKDIPNVILNNAITTEKSKPVCTPNNQSTDCYDISFLLKEHPELRQLLLYSDGSGRQYLVSRQIDLNQGGKIFVDLINEENNHAAFRTTSADFKPISYAGICGEPCPQTMVRVVFYSCKRADGSIPDYGDSDSQATFPFTCDEPKSRWSSPNGICATSWIPVSHCQYLK